MAVRNFKTLFILFLLTNIFIVGFNLFSSRSTSEVDAQQCVKVMQGINLTKGEVHDSDGACGSAALNDFGGKQFALCSLVKVEDQEDSSYTDNMAECRLWRTSNNLDGRDTWMLQAIRIGSPNHNTCVKCAAYCIN